MLSSQSKQTSNDDKPRGLEEISNVDDLVPDVSSPDEKPLHPIQTTTNTVPHVPFDQPVEPSLDGDEHTIGVEKRPQPQTKDSVLEITKAIPGGFA